MESNNDWVDDQLAKLNPDAAWRPNVERSLTQAKQRTSRNRIGGRKWVWAAAGVVAGSVLLYALPRPEPRVASVSASVKALTEGQPAPDFTLRNAAGARVTLSSYKGKAVLLNFWATWCGGCKLEIPWLIDFETRYKAQGFEVVGVAMDDDGWKKITPSVAEKKMNYTVLLGNDDVAKRYGVEAMPMTLLIDRGGKLAALHIGTLDPNVCEGEIRRLLSLNKGQ